MKSFIQLANRGFAKTIKLTNVRQIVGFNYDEFVQHDNVDVYLRSGKIAKIGKNIPEIGENSIKPDKIIDLEGALVTPGFIDPHTHIFPPKDRADEFSKRTNMTYQEIAEGGGGILSSVKACRSATFEEIFDVNERNVKRFIANGTTTLEMKSGYGLNLETEILLLNVIKALKEKYYKQIKIIPTFLGAHAFPPEYKDKKEEYVTLICEKMIPEIAS